MTQRPLIMVAVGALVALGLGLGSGAAVGTGPQLDTQTGEFPLCAHYNFLYLDETGETHLALEGNAPEDFAGYVEVEDPNNEYEVNVKNLNARSGQTVHVDFYDIQGENTGVKGSEPGETQGIPPNSAFGFVCIDERGNVPGEQALPSLAYFAVPSLDAEWDYVEHAPIS